MYVFFIQVVVRILFNVLAHLSYGTLVNKTKYRPSYIYNAFYDITRGVYGTFIVKHKLQKKEGVWEGKISHLEPAILYTQ